MIIYRSELGDTWSIFPRIAGVSSRTPLLNHIYIYMSFHFKENPNKEIIGKKKKKRNEIKANTQAMFLSTQIFRIL